MDTILENENAEAPQEERLLPVVALGAAAIRMARILNEKFGGLDLYEILDILEKGESLEFAPTFAIPESRPIRFLMYDRAEVEDGMAKAVAEKAKTGGKLFTFEIAAPGEKMRPSWRLGTDVLIRAMDEAQCLAAAGLLLHMASPHQPVAIDADDVLSLFDSTDVVHVGIGTATGAQAVDAAVEQALGALGWKPEFLRGILLSITGNESLGMKEIDAATTAIMERASKDCNIVFGAEIDPTIGDDVRVTILATCGKRKDSHDASKWMMEMLEEKFATGDNR